MLHLYKEKIAINKNDLPNAPSIKKIIDTFTEEDALQVIMYIYLLYNRSDENPIKEFPISERSRRARKLAFGDATITIQVLFPKSEKLIGKAIKEYEKETIDKIQKDIDLYDKKMYQFISMLNENEPTILKNVHEHSAKTIFTTNIDIITTILDNSINIILDKAALTLLKKTGKFSNDLRGKLSPNVKGKLTNKNINK